MIYRISCILLLVFVLVPYAKAGTGFTTQAVTDWPRPYQHFSDNIVQYWPKVASNGDSFLLTWYEQYEEPESIINTPVYAARYSSTGQLLDQEAICLAETGSYVISQEPAVCAVGDNYWVFYGYYGLHEIIYAKSISPEGTVSDAIAVGDAVGAATITSLATASVSSGNVLAAWLNAGDNSIGYSVLTPAGQQVVDSNILIRDFEFVDCLAVAASGSNFLITFYVKSGTSAPDTLCAMRVDAQGNILDQQPIVIASDDLGGWSFDVIPYQDGWLAVYSSSAPDTTDEGTTWGLSLRGRGIASDGAVSNTLFIVWKSVTGYLDDSAIMSDNVKPNRRNPFYNAMLGDSDISVRQTPEGYLLSWSEYDCSTMQTNSIEQYGMIYGSSAITLERMFANIS